MQSFFRYFTLIIFSLVVFSSCSQKVTIDPPSKLTRLNAKKYVITGTCSSESSVSVEYQIGGKKSKSIDWVNCKNEKWSVTADFSKIDRNRVKEITLTAQALNKFSSDSDPVEAKVVVLPNTFRAFIDDSILAKQIDPSQSEELVISGGCAWDGDGLTLLLGEEVVDYVTCEKGLWETTINLQEFSWEEGDRVNITVRHEDGAGVITEDSHQLHYLGENA